MGDLVITRYVFSSKIIPLSETPTNSLVCYDNRLGLSEGKYAAKDYNGVNHIRIRWIADKNSIYGDSIDLEESTLVEFLFNPNQD